MVARCTRLALLFIFGWTLLACDRDYREETDLIEEAETHYTAGDYETAQQLYRRFLERHPRSPYAEIAAQRLRIAERELDALMGQPGMPTPKHVEQRVRFQGHDDDRPDNDR
jgi:hypothetical protein